MAKIVVFDSGFGSLSIIKPIQEAIKSHIIYFADQKNFPYGKKSKSELTKIIIKTLNFLDQQFHPDLIVIGSNTPSLLLGNNLLIEKICRRIIAYDLLFYEILIVNLLYGCFMPNFNF